MQTETDYVLAIDLGSSGPKVSLVSQQGQIDLLPGIGPADADGRVARLAHLGKQRSGLELGGATGPGKRDREKASNTVSQGPVLSHQKCSR